MISGGAGIVSDAGKSPLLSSKGNHSKDNLGDAESFGVSMLQTTFEVEHNSQQEVPLHRKKFDTLSTDQASGYGRNSNITGSQSKFQSDSQLEQAPNIINIQEVTKSKKRSMVYPARDKSDKYSKAQSRTIHILGRKSPNIRMLSSQQHKHEKNFVSKNGSLTSTIRQKLNDKKLINRAYQTDKSWNRRWQTKKHDSRTRDSKDLQIV